MPFLMKSDDRGSFILQEQRRSLQFEMEKSGKQGKNIRERDSLSEWIFHSLFLAGQYFFDSEAEF